MIVELFTYLNGSQFSHGLRWESGVILLKGIGKFQAKGSFKDVLTDGLLLCETKEGHTSQILLGALQHDAVSFGWVLIGRHCRVVTTS